MKYLMMVLSWLFCLWGVLSLLFSSSAIHEIAAFVLLLIWAVLLSGSMIIHALDGRSA